LANEFLDQQVAELLRRQPQAEFERQKHPLGLGEENLKYLAMVAFLYESLDLRRIQDRIFYVS
jgi:RsiW-degrading membrane proteinase PrsW (M82 family)